MNETLKAYGLDWKIMLGLFAALIVVGLFAALLIGSAVQRPEYHYGDAIRFNDGFYKGCEGYLVEAKRDKDVGEITAYVANVTCGPDTFHFGLTPLATSVICSPGSFEVIKDTTTEK